MDFIMGGIIQFGGNFAPKDWAFCNGQLIAISQNQALYAILGTTWGGDGRTNFGLPDLRGRIPIGVGRGPGLTEVFQGQKRGMETNSLQVDNLPAHTHDAAFSGTGGGSPDPISATVTVKASTESTSGEPAGKYWGVSKQGFNAVTAYSSTAETTMASDAVAVNIQGGGGITGGNVTVNPTGANTKFSIMNPDLGMQFILAVQGIFPSRN